MVPLKIPHPAAIVAHLNNYVIGQDDAKESLAVAARNHYVLQGKDHRTRTGVVVDKIDQFHTLIIGPTGSGKTHLLKALARFIEVPFVELDATKCTESGYVGDKVENALISLCKQANWDLERAQMGIIYIDEFDKLARAPGSVQGRDVSGVGVQQGMLSLLGGIKIRLKVEEASQPDLKEIEFDTSRVLFICGGAFVGLERIIESRLTGKGSIGFGAPLVTREEDPKKVYEFLRQVEPEDIIKFGLMPELVGRFPNLTATQLLTVKELFRILKEPRNCLVDQEKALFREDVNLTFTDPALMEMAKEAHADTTGARALKRIMGATMKPTNLLLPKNKRIDVGDVRNRAEKLAAARKKLKRVAAARVRASDSAVKKAPPVMMVFRPADTRKEIVSTELALPMATWEVWKRGDDSRSIQLVRTADNRSFYVLRMKLDGVCDRKHRTPMVLQWIVPYRRGVHPVSMIGPKFDVGWYCGASHCSYPEAKDRYVKLNEKDWDWQPND